MRDEDRERFRERLAKDAVDWLQVDLPRILGKMVKMLEETRGWLEKGEINLAIGNLDMLLSGTKSLIDQAQGIGNRVIWEEGKTDSG